MSWQIRPGFIGGRSAIAPTPVGGTSAEYTAFAARTSGLDSTHLNAYGALIDGLVADGIWSKFDGLYIFATQDSTTAKLNLVQNTYNLTQHGSPTFTADRGFTGTDSSSTVYFDTGFNPVTAVGAQYVQNSAHMSAWQVTNTSSAGAPIGSIDNGSGHAAYVQPRDSGSGNFKSGINSTGTASFASVGGSDFSGHFIGNRDTSSSQQFYRNGSSFGTSGNGSTLSSLSLNLYAMAYNSAGTASGCGSQHSMVSFGSSLGSTDASNFYTRLRTYMTAVGVP